MKPGQYVLATTPIVCNEGKEAITLHVVNRGDRPIQVGSHFHFAETNSALDFDRDAALGKRLDIPAGTAARFEPGDVATVQLIDFGGTREIYGFRGEINGKVNGQLNSTLQGKSTTPTSTRNGSAGSQQ